MPGGACPLACPSFAALPALPLSLAASRFSLTALLHLKNHELAPLPPCLLCPGTSPKHPSNKSSLIFPLPPVEVSGQAVSTSVASIRLLCWEDLLRLVQQGATEPFLGVQADSLLQDAHRSPYLFLCVSHLLPLTLCALLPCLTAWLSDASTVASLLLPCIPHAAEVADHHLQQNCPS